MRKLVVLVVSVVAVLGSAVAGAYGNQGQPLPKVTSAIQK